MQCPSIIWCILYWRGNDKLVLLDVIWYYLCLQGKQINESYFPWEEYNGVERVLPSRLGVLATLVVHHNCLVMSIDLEPTLQYLSIRLLSFLPIVSHCNAQARQKEAMISYCYSIIYLLPLSEPGLYQASGFKKVIWSLQGCWLH